MADIYRFLSKSMQYPNADWMDEKYFTAIYTFLDELGWHDDASALRSALSEKNDWLESLQLEHTRLFVNAVPTVIAPPYGSVYLSSDGMLYGPSAVKTKEFYQERGFGLSGEFDIPDHITFELEFLALLADDGREEDEELFLKKHFRPWFPIFRDRVLNEVRHPFYGVLVKLIDFFTREEL